MDQALRPGGPGGRRHVGGAIDVKTLECAPPPWRENAD